MWDATALLLSPEQLGTQGFRKLFDNKSWKNRVDSVGVDETHLLGAWGDSSRPAGEFSCSAFSKYSQCAQNDSVLAVQPTLHLSLERSFATSGAFAPRPHSDVWTNLSHAFSPTGRIHFLPGKRPISSSAQKCAHLGFALCLHCAHVTLSRGQHSWPSAFSSPLSLPFVRSLSTELSSSMSTIVSDAICSPCCYAAQACGIRQPVRPIPPSDSCANAESTSIGFLASPFAMYAYANTLTIAYALQLPNNRNKRRTLFATLAFETGAILG